MPLGSIFYSYHSGQEVVYCLQLLGTKASSGRVTAVLALPLVRLIFN